MARSMVRMGRKVVLPREILDGTHDPGGRKESVRIVKVSVFCAGKITSER